MNYVEGGTVTTHSVATDAQDDVIIVAVDYVHEQIVFRFFRFLTELQYH